MNLFSWRTIKGSSIDGNLLKGNILLYRNKDTPKLHCMSCFPYLKRSMDTFQGEYELRNAVTLTWGEQ